MNDEPVKRVPVDFDYQGLNPQFLKWMAKIVIYANGKYGAWHQYTNAELTGDKSPLNHIIEHWRQYQEGEPYDHFDGDLRWHLVAIAYNAMMAFFQHTRWGWRPHPLSRSFLLSTESRQQFQAARTWCPAKKGYLTEAEEAECRKRGCLGAECKGGISVP